MLYAAFVVFAVLFVAYANGANDNFKGVATLFGSGTTGYRGALAWGTLTTFAGSITDERLRDGLKVIAENTPGVTAVHDHVAWIEPNSGVVIPTEEDDARERS